MKKISSFTIANLEKHLTKLVEVLDNKKSDHGRKSLVNHMRNIKTEIAKRKRNKILSELKLQNKTIGSFISENNKHITDNKPIVIQQDPIKETLNLSIYRSAPLNNK